ncbi:MAG TPA: carboxypeptidase-like regulatory domain-containing protein [Pirellulaceae bacterium]
MFRISCFGFRASAGLAVLFVVVIMAAAGCGSGGGNLPKTVPAMGVVTLDGKPVDGAQVVLVPPVGAGAKGAYAVTNSSGHFSLRAYEEKEGAIPGDYKVQVSKTVEEKLPGAKGSVDGGDPVRYVFGVPKKYTGFETSGLSVSIPDAGKRDIKLELTSK